MSARSPSGMFHPRPRKVVVDEMVARARARLLALDVAQRDALFEDTVFHERKRLERGERGGGASAEGAAIDQLARALLRRSAEERVEAALAVVRAWVEEIHGTFSRRAYAFATTAFPPAVGALLSARPQHLTDWNLDVKKRVEIDGDLPLLRTLAEEATLILAPTHVSNLDSPIIGLALFLAGLPPFQYGAGLNLFSNPILGWWMSRLGAYTVDRTKEAALYKDVLKDYSVYQLTQRHHSLFFPGGTRARSGAIETRVKKGLLGTGVAAWQEMVAAGRPDPDVYVVPLTLSFTLTLEASTLISDFLEDEGRQRYIITDDEFAQARRVAAFVQRVGSLDSAVVCRFGAPLDVLGHPVPADAQARKDASARRRAYICDRHGQVESDPQRDRVYTDRLADALVRAWPRDATVMSTHLLAHVAWAELAHQLGTRDTFRIVRSARERRQLPRAAVIARLTKAHAAIKAGTAAGRWHDRLPDRVDDTLCEALDRLGRYHTTLAVASTGGVLSVDDPRLCLYYRNRLAFAGLED